MEPPRDPQGEDPFDKEGFNATQYVNKLFPDGEAITLYRFGCQICLFFRTLFIYYAVYLL